MEKTQRIYLPAAGRQWLLPLYDPVTKLMGVEAVHRRLLEQANIQSDHRILEIGCGTGNLAMLAKTVHPRAKVVGLDPDPMALARARRKTDRRGLEIGFDRGFANDLSYPDGSFDRVLSAFMFHHLLNLEDKIRTLKEARRVLAPGGSLHLVDFGGAAGHQHGFIARLLHRSERLRDNAGERICALLKQAGFEDPTEVGHQALTIFGRVTYYRVSSPSIGGQKKFSKPGTVGVAVFNERV